MDEHEQHQQWKKIEHRLAAAAKRLTEAGTLLDELPNAGHISGNLVPVYESVVRFRDLATDKVAETKPETTKSTRPW